MFSGPVRSVKSALTAPHAPGAPLRFLPLNGFAEALPLPLVIPGMKGKFTSFPWKNYRICGQLVI